MKRQSSAMASGARQKLVKLGPKLSRLVCQNPAREAEKPIKKTPKHPQKAACLCWIILIHSYVADIIQINGRNIKYFLK